MSTSYSRAANLLGALALAVSDRLREAAAEPAEEMAMSQAAALVTLYHYPGQSIRALGAAVGLTHSGAVRLADRLQADGLARRAPAGPGRTIALRLTAAGELAARRVVARRRAAAEQLTSVLDPGQAAALEQVAARLLAALTTDRGSARRLCRLCDEPLCAEVPGCPVDRAVRE